MDDFRFYFYLLFCSGLSLSIMNIYYIIYTKKSALPEKKLMVLIGGRKHTHTAFTIVAGAVPLHDKEHGRRPTRRGATGQCESWWSPCPGLPCFPRLLLREQG